jgi:dephospho-CoA kinase
VLLVALTGGIGSGKSTVAGLLAGHGASVLDADAVARSVVEPGRPALAALVERFGGGILQPDGRLDRSALAAAAFADDESRHALEAITHPVIVAEMNERIAEQPDDAVVVLEIQLLAETWDQRIRDYDAVVAVEAPEALRLGRAVERGMSREDAERRLGAQATDDDRRHIATHVVANAGTVEELAGSVALLWADLLTLRDRKAGVPPG